MSMLVRIKPHLPVNSYGRFFKAVKWYGVDEATAAWCASQRINDINPNSDLVFDVMSQEQARLLEQEEQRREDPIGTADRPMVLQPLAPPPAATEGPLVDSGEAKTDDAQPDPARPKLKR